MHLICGYVTRKTLIKRTVYQNFTIKLKMLTSFSFIIYIFESAHTQLGTLIWTNFHKKVAQVDETF